MDQQKHPGYKKKTKDHPSVTFPPMAPNKRYDKSKEENIKKTKICMKRIGNEPTLLKIAMTSSSDDKALQDISMSTPQLVVEGRGSESAMLKS